MSPRRDERRLGIRQRRGRPSDAHGQATDLANAALYQEYLRARTWLTVAQVKDYLGFPSEAAVREWASRHPRLRKGRRGRTLVFRRTTLDQFIEPAVK